MSYSEKTASVPWQNKRAALVIAHPGHELRVHHWLELARPITFVITDGSGHGKQGRIQSTSALLHRVGARAGPIYARFSDQQLYQAILSGDCEPFICLAAEIAEIFDSESIDYVVGDAVEGFNPAHDVCRLLINAALLLQSRRSHSQRVANLEFAVEGPPDECPDDGLTLGLGQDAFQRKLAACRSYPEMATEVEHNLATYGERPFRIECIRHVKYGLDIEDCFESPCFYERHGERRVAEGFYTEVIRFREHLLPIAAALKVASDR